MKKQRAKSLYKLLLLLLPFSICSRSVLIYQRSLYFLCVFLSLRAVRRGFHCYIYLDEIQNPSQVSYMFPSKVMEKGRAGEPEMRRELKIFPVQLTVSFRLISLTQGCLAMIQSKGMFCTNLS